MKREHKPDRTKPRAIPFFSTLLAAFSLIALMSCLSIGFLTYFLRADGIRSEQYRLLETLRDEKIGHLSNWFQERAVDVRIMSNLPNIVTFCEAPTKTDTLFSDEIITSLTNMQKAYRFDSMFLADQDGITIASTEGQFSEPQSLPLRQAFMEQAITSKRIVISDVLISKVHFKPTVFLFAPIFAPGTAEVTGLLGVLIDPTEWLYPRFAQSKYLGETGEILLVNSDLVTQSPLKYREGAVSSLKIQAEPAIRGAAGEIGRIAINDYRPEHVMAAYGHIPELNWGIVVKQDMSEINAPVRAMARNVTAVSAAVLLLALLFGMIIARRISRPSLIIATTASQIGQGNHKLRVPLEGPAEIQQIAMNMNAMVTQLGLQVHVTQSVTDLLASASKYNKLADLLEDILPALMKATRSQLGVVYLTDSVQDTLALKLVHGFNQDCLSQQISLNPPDHLLAENLISGQVQILTDLPDGHELHINTQAGLSSPRALLSIPLVLGKGHVGVIGLASLYDYEIAAKQVADGVKTYLAQAIEVCRSFEQSEEMRFELNEINEELRASAVELQANMDEQSNLVTELENQRHQIAEADRLKSEFLSNMSHELRTPLNSVLSLTQLMISDSSKTKEDIERLEIIERNGSRLLNLINDILDLSKIESGKMDFYMSSFTVNELVSSVIRAISPLAQEKGLSIVEQVDGSLIMQSDQDKLYQILLNLISNASKFTEKGEIGIKVQQANESMVFTVWDTGCGIPEHSLPFIFDEFRQVDGSTTRQYGGTGLGLAISKRLTALLGGTIEVESEEAKGTCFRVTFPIGVQKLTASFVPDQFPIPNEAREWDPDNLPKNILVIEDDDIASEQISLALRDKGFGVSVAHTGEEALNMICEELPDGLVLDLMMPGIDGFEVLRRLRAEPETARLPVLILTAKDLTAAEREFLTQGNAQLLFQKGQLHREQLVESMFHLVGCADHLVHGQTHVAVSTTHRLIEPKDGQLKILIVEDNPDNMTVTKDILGEIDATLYEAWNGQEAIETAKKLRPDMILMDINLPVMSGLEATTLIRKDKELRNIVIIALTARAMMGDREMILKAGCDDYLSKPVSPNKLKTTITKWIAGE
jgi:signal transduction histidine kinase/DNA-binding response OmpR family regulator/HAMP domain-containing protein